MGNDFLVLLAVALGTSDPLPLVVVDRDNVVISESCRVRVTAAPITDADGNGVVHIVGNGISVTFEEGPLRGAEDDQAPDSFDGIGIRITGGNVTLSGAVIQGYRIGVFAQRAVAMVIEDCDVSGNFSQRLASTPQHEDPADWLRPHANDSNEWIENYGAGIYVEQTANAVIRRVRAWGTQNGIVLSRCTGTKVYDNDCSFGSGWGLAMWRCRDNTISRNAFDFRVRGYSHGVYNRGQDSAGILLFEQCSDNVITHNSATHCGDGLFAFAGREALGQAGTPHTPAWYLRRGNNSNVIADNDFSFAAAHGIEITFSFGNQVVSNRVVGAAICGLWGGYSQQTFIAGNHFESNGDMPYGLERGGINIEHGFANIIYRNQFLDNACGVHLWWDRDEQLTALPWAKANPTAAENNSIIDNTFERDAVAVQLREVGRVSLIGNRMIDVGVELEADEQSLSALYRADNFGVPPLPIEDPEAIGDTNPIGARAHLDGREHIVMTRWGPYDWTSPLLRQVERSPRRHVYELLGPERIGKAALEMSTGVQLQRDGSRLIVTSDSSGTYELHVTAGTTTLVRKGVME